MTNRSPYIILRKIYSELKRSNTETSGPGLLDRANFGVTIASLIVAVIALIVSAVALCEARTASNLSASAANQGEELKRLASMDEKSAVSLDRLSSMDSNSAASLDQLTTEVQTLQSLVRLSAGQYKMAVQNQLLRVSADSQTYINRLVFFEKELEEAHLYFQTYQTKVEQNTWVDSMRRMTTNVVQACNELKNNLFLIEHPILRRPVYSFYAKMSRLDDLLRIKEGVQIRAYYLLNQIYLGGLMWLQNPNDTSQARQCAANLDKMLVN
jgi:hypothetical protein